MHYLFLCALQLCNGLAVVNEINSAVFVIHFALTNPFTSFKNSHSFKMLRNSTCVVTDKMLHGIVVVFASKVKHNLSDWVRNERAVRRCCVDSRWIELHTNNDSAWNVRSANTMTTHLFETCLAVAHMNGFGVHTRTHATDPTFPSDCFATEEKSTVCGMMHNITSPQLNESLRCEQFVVCCCLVQLH